MTDQSSPMLRFLHGAACLVIIMWGVRTASHLLALLFLAIMLAYCVLPFPKWLMRRFQLGKSAAMALTVASMGTLNLVMGYLVYWRALRLKEKLPIYHEHFMALYEKVLVFLQARGVEIGDLAATKVSTSERILEFARTALPEAASLLADGLMVSLLAWIFLIEMADQAAAKKGSLAERLARYSGDVQRYIATAAKTGAITALANLALLLVAGVDFPLLWCVLYFFLQFIPSLGFIIALVPPTFLTLLMLGWERALLVAGGLVVTQMLSDYVLNPILMKKGVHISLLEIMASLLFWGFLLGPAGGVLAVPLTLALKRFMVGFSSAESLEAAPSG